MSSSSSTRTDLLDIGYEQWGPADGPVVVALHGFPDNATSWQAVGEQLATSGVRLVAPHLRGVGPTRFRDGATPRTGQLGALVSDLTSFLDALGLARVTLAGQDWGSRTAQGLAARHPERVSGLVSLGSYGLSWDGDGFPPPSALHALWYQWVLLLDLGPIMLRSDPAVRDAFYRYLWEAWSPTWTGRRAVFEQVADSLSSTDFTEVVLSAYRHGRAETVTDPRYDDLDAALDAGPQVPVPTTILLGADDGVEQPRPDDERDAAYFPNLVERRLLPAVGHVVQREAPADVAAALLGHVRREQTTSLTGVTA